MITYAINLCTDTKNTDRYDKVAVNKYPIIIRCENDEQMKQYLSSKETSDYIKELLKYKHLYESAVFFIRKIDKANITEITLNITDLVEIDYK